MSSVVVLGGGLAGATAVEELREQGYDGDLTLVGAEPHLPYERPPLSKGVLLGTDEPGSVFVHDRPWYDGHGVDLRLGEAASEIDLAGRQVVVGAERLRYDRLLVATGSTPRHLPLLDSSDLEVLYLRTLEDSLRLKNRLSGHVLVVGAGWIGLEVASAARRAGAEVTVVETAKLPLLAALGPEVAAVFAELHRDHGVDLRLETGLGGVEGRAVTLTDGHRLEPDLVVVGIGAAPADRVAAAAGLATGNGLLVDARLRTGDPHTFAAGDVADHDHLMLGRLRVEHWDNAIGQGRHAARSLLGDPRPYDRLPYFFTDQHDLGMEYVGHVGAAGYDEVVVRGDLDRRVFTALWTSRGRVAAGLHVNDWDAIDHLRRLVGRPADARLRDPSVALADL